jgi:Sec-independent protein secretion pathway component TatC
MAGPLVVLYEISIIAVRFFGQRLLIPEVDKEREERENTQGPCP